MLGSDPDREKDEPMAIRKSNSMDPPVRAMGRRLADEVDLIVNGRFAKLISRATAVDSLP